MSSSASQVQRIWLRLTSVLFDAPPSWHWTSETLLLLTTAASPPTVSEVMFVSLSTMRSLEGLPLRWIERESLLYLVAFSILYRVSKRVRFRPRKSDRM